MLTLYVISLKLHYDFDFPIQMFCIEKPTLMIQNYALAIVFRIFALYQFLVIGIEFGNWFSIERQKLHIP